MDPKYFNDSGGNACKLLGATLRLLDALRRDDDAEIILRMFDAQFVVEACQEK
jgi:hypothetical protein